MIDQLEPLRMFRADVAASGPEVRVAARSALIQAIHAEQRRQETSARLIPFPGAMRNRQAGWVASLWSSGSHRSPGVRLAAAAVVVAVAIAGLRLAGGLPGSAAHSPRPYSATSLSRAILTASHSTAGEVLFVKQTTTTSDGHSEIVYSWIYPAGKPQTGQQVEWRGLVLKADGTPLHDGLLKYVAGGPRAAFASKPGAFYDSGEIIDVEYSTKSWSDQLNQTIAGWGYPFDGDLLEREIASGDVKVSGTDEVAGQRVIELSSEDLAGNHILWLSATTYLPVKSIFKYVAGTETAPIYGTSESDYEYLPPTSENLAQLQPTIPASFTRTAGPPNLYPQS